MNELLWIVEAHRPVQISAEPMGESAFVCNGVLYVLDEDIWETEHEACEWARRNALALEGYYEHQARWVEERMAELERDAELEREIAKADAANDWAKEEPAVRALERASDA